VKIPLHNFIIEQALYCGIALFFGLHVEQSEIFGCLLSSGGIISLPKFHVLPLLYLHFFDIIYVEKREIQVFQANL